MFSALISWPAPCATTGRLTGPRGSAAAAFMMGAGIAAVAVVLFVALVHALSSSATPASHTAPPAGR